MKINNYMVSVQWGEGLHYIHKFFYTHEAAVAEQITRQAQLNLVRKRNKKGAKPYVRIWLLTNKAINTLDK